MGLRRFMAGARVKEEPLITVANLPVAEDLPPTPESWQEAHRNEAGLLEEVVLLLCASLLGDPFGWTGSQGGRLVHDVCPSRSMEESLTNASSRAALNLHTEDVFHPCRGDYVSLFCLRNPDRVGTTISRITASDNLRGLTALWDDRFRFFPDDAHFADSTEADLTGRQSEWGSVLFGPRNEPYLRIDPDFTRPEPGDDQAEQSLRECEAHLADAAERVVLEPGEAVFVDNYRVVHGRETFTPRYDGTDRWLKRTNLARDIRRAYIHQRSRSRVLS
ncbi:TauD/TfdA family dioxygenase [Streptomyces sp. HK10]|uniref:TauD/TfdA family dioxygenase n=1 Tax=Streptomyces sp. HK10 TaxID=3373255 RepID=UPI003749D63F